MTKEELHRIVDNLSEIDTDAAARILKALRAREIDPVTLALLLAPEDDEPLTAEDLRALEEAHQDEAAGRIVPHPEAKRRLLDR
jgi:hypothetical protein